MAAMQPQTGLLGYRQICENLQSGLRRQTVAGATALVAQRVHGRAPRYSETHRAVIPAEAGIHFDFCIRARWMTGIRR
jgi:hypothetical protein